MDKNIEINEQSACPECNNISHSPAAFAYHPCPSCGTVFNKHGKDRRIEPRIIKSIPSMLHVEGAYDKISFSAKTIDVSDSGAAIRYNIFPLPQNSVVELEIMAMTIARIAVVVWSKEISKIESKSGLRFFQPIQPTLPPAA